MLIATLDNDREFTKRMNKLLKSLLTDVDYIAFYSSSDCLQYTMEHDISLVFISQNIGKNFFDLQLLHHKLRKIRPHIDTVIVYDENELNNSVALWAIQSRCSDYICKSSTEERLREALQNTWFHTISEADFLKCTEYAK